MSAPTQVKIKRTAYMYATKTGVDGSIFDLGLIGCTHPYPFVEWLINTYISAKIKFYKLTKRI